MFYNISLYFLFKVLFETEIELTITCTYTCSKIFFVLVPINSTLMTPEKACNAKDLQLNIVKPIYCMY